MKKVCFHFPLLFFRIWTKKDDGRVGAAKAKDADNIVSIPQSVWNCDKRMSVGTQGAPPQ